MPSGGLEPRRPELRASHEDRDRAVDRLRVAAGDGRLAPEELDERIEQALAARTYGELEVLLHDLPDVPSGRPAAVAKDTVELRASMGNVNRTGSWTVPRRMTVQAYVGNVLLDFTDATVTEPHFDLDVQASHGSVRLIVPDDVDVQVEDVSVYGGNVRRKKAAGQPASGPVRLRVTVSGTVRMGNLIVRGPRRTFREWLLRRPATPRD